MLKVKCHFKTILKVNLTMFFFQVFLVKVYFLEVFVGESPMKSSIKKKQVIF